MSRKAYSSLNNFAKKHNAYLFDWTDMLDDAENEESSKNGYSLFALFVDQDDCEPDVMFIKYPDEDLYRVRNLCSSLADGEMLSAKDIKEFIKTL